MPDTGFKSPTDWDVEVWTSPSNVFSSNDSYAESGGGQQPYKDFSFVIPSGREIVGIEVAIEGHGTGLSAATLKTSLSWDGGTTYTSEKSAIFDVGGDVTQTYGGSADLWGRTWADTEFSDANFRLRSRRNPLTSDGIDVDHIQVKVYYVGEDILISVVTAMVL